MKIKISISLDQEVFNGMDKLKAPDRAMSEYINDVLKQWLLSEGVVLKGGIN